MADLINKILDWIGQCVTILSDELKVDVKGKTTKFYANTIKEFTSFMIYYSGILKRITNLNKISFQTGKTVKDFLVINTLMIPFAIVAYAIIISFYPGALKRSTRFIPIGLASVYFFVAGNFKNDLQKAIDFESLARSLGFSDDIIKFYSSFLTSSFIISVVMFSLCSIAYKLVRVVIFLLALYKFKRMVIFTEGTSIRFTLPLFIFDVFLYFVFSKIVNVAEDLISALIYSSVGTLTIIYHFKMFAVTENNVNRFFEFICGGLKFEDISTNPMLPIWCVLLFISFNEQYKRFFIPKNKQFR